MKIFSLLFLFLLLGTAPAAAIPSDDALGATPALPPPAPAQAAVIHARPALWHVRGKLGDVYLLGSIHALPPDLDWQTPRIKKAMARANVFVFEVSADTPALQRAASLVAAHGLLPPGQELRTLLPASAQADYDADVAAAGLSPTLLANKRPWLASLMLAVAQMRQEHFLADAGVDRVVMAIAHAAGKPMRYFETIDQQFALLAPDDSNLELSEFESDLTDLRTQKTELGQMVDAWSHGDPRRIDRLMNADLASHPDAKKALLDDRNKRWVLQIETMLLEKRTFFITVGAGHLAGPVGVPALLRKAGYRVQGP